MTTNNPKLDAKIKAKAAKLDTKLKAKTAKLSHKAHLCNAKKTKVLGTSVATTKFGGIAGGAAGVFLVKAVIVSGIGILGYGIYSLFKK